MKALLLLAGRSRRFWPLEEKSLFPICGKTLLEHQIDRLKEAGCDEIILVGGAHNLDQVKSLFPDLKTIEQENLDLGMRGALLSALPECGSDPVLIVSGNDVIESSGYKDVIGAAKDGSTTLTTGGALLAYKVDRYFPGGYLSLDGDRITSIVEKPGEGSEPSDLVNIVAHVHSDPSALLDALKDVDESTDDGYEQALAKLFKEKDYRAASYEGMWQPVKYPWHMVQLLRIFLKEITEQSIHPNAEVHPSAVITGNVVIEEGVRVFPNACISGPCYIGKDAIIANNSLTRGSSIGKNGVVGYNTEIKGSVLGDHVWTHMNYVGDSVIGRNVSFGGGTVIGNLRLDEEEVTSEVDGEKVSTDMVKFGAAIGSDCRLGINVSINPGKKIGKGSFVATKVLVDSDIPEKSFVVMKEGKVEIKENRVEVPQPEDRDGFRSSI